MKEDIKLTEQDKIENVETDTDGKVVEVTMVDGNKFTFQDFIELFKLKLQTIVAGEVISWDDEWRYQRQIDPKTMESYLDIVEAEGLVANAKFQLTRGQKIGVGVILIIFFALVFGLIFMKNAGLF